MSGRKHDRELFQMRARKLLQPVMFSILEDDIAEKLARLDGRLLDIYRTTGRRWKELSKKVE